MTSEAAKAVAVQAAEAAQAARDRLASLRLQRVRGEGGPKIAAEIAAARDAVEVAEDRAKLAQEDATAAARAAAAEAAHQAARARHAAVTAIYAEMRSLDAELVEAAERLAAVFIAIDAHARETVVAEPAALDVRWLNGRVLRAMATITAAWPHHIDLPATRPIPYRDAAERARHPEHEAADRANRLPIPPDPDAPDGLVARITLDDNAVAVEAAA